LNIICIDKDFIRADQIAAITLSTYDSELTGRIYVYLVGNEKPLLYQMPEKTNITKFYVNIVEQWKKAL
jgi:hypothetical protein